MIKVDLQAKQAFGFQPNIIYFNNNFYSINQSSYNIKKFKKPGNIDQLIPVKLEENEHFISLYASNDHLFIISNLDKLYAIDKNDKITVSNLPISGNWNCGIYIDKHIIFSIGGEYTKIIMSTDLMTWSIAVNNYGINGIRKIVYGNGIYIALMNDESNVLISNDGLSWNKRDISSLPQSISITFDNDYFIIVSSRSKNVLISKDGNMWELISIWPTDTFINKIDFYNMIIMFDYMHGCIYYGNNLHQLNSINYLKKNQRSRFAITTSAVEYINKKERIIATDTEGQYLLNINLIND